MPENVSIEIENPHVLAGKAITGQRVPLGTPGDYKPCIARRPTGELLLVAYVLGKLDAGKCREEILLFRSSDGGRTWSKPENLTVDKGLVGREPYFTILNDGTLFITVHWLPQDVRNTSGYCQSYVHRSDDAGKTWQTVRAEPEGMQPGESTCTSRNILEAQDAALMLGVSARGREDSCVWRSIDRGRTWSERYRAEFRGLPQDHPTTLFGEAVWWQARSGKIYLIRRVDSRHEKIGGQTVPSGKWCDSYDRMVLYTTTDGGRTFEPLEPLGGIGEFYPSILRLQDNRLLLTFTARGRRPFGVRAVLGEELEDGFRFDLEHDRFMLETRTESDDPNWSSGFGPTVQLDDGALLTSYSWRDAPGVPHLELIRWRLPET